MLSFKQFIVNPISEGVKWDYSRGDNYNKNVAGFHIINHRTGQKVGMAKTLNGARKSIDNHDNKYGAYAHTAHPVYHDTLGESTDEVFVDEAVTANDNVPGGIKVIKVSNDNKKKAVVAEESNSEIAKKAHKGENVGHGGFNKVADSAAKEYGSEKAGEKVAAAVMWKKYGHKK